jgi:ATP-dependent Clp protease ATP-binding subunit ClpA
MARLIQEKVKQPLAEELLFGKLAHGGEVHVSVKDDKLGFELSSAAPKATKPKKRRKPVAETAPETSVDGIVEGDTGED